MNGLLLVGMLATVFGTPTQAPVSETVRLRHRSPAKLARTLRLPADLEQITFNFKESTVTLKGARSAVLAALEQIFEADTEPVAYRVELRVTKRIVDADGAATEYLFDNSWASATDESPVSFATDQDEAMGQSITVKVTPAGKESVRLEVAMRMRDQAGNLLSSATRERTLKIGEITGFGGMTAGKDAALRDAVEAGERPKDRGRYTAYYVELGISLPTEQKAKIRR